VPSVAESAGSEADLRDMGGTTTRRFSAVGGANPMANARRRGVPTKAAGGGGGGGDSDSDGEGQGQGGRGAGDAGAGADGGAVPPPLPLAQRMQARAKTDGTGKVGRRMSQRAK